MKALLLFTLTAVLLVPRPGFAEITGRFAPPAGKVLVFAGQDNASVGGTADYRDGYVDNVQVPGGITHYVYFSEGWTNGFGRTFAKGSVAGLNTETWRCRSTRSLKVWKVRGSIEVATRAYSLR